MMVDRIDTRTSVALKRWPIVVLRLYTGVFFAYHGISKIRRDDFADGLAGFISQKLETSFPFYRPFLESVILPSNELFALLIAWGELAIGVALILGLATRYAAFIGAFMVMNFWFSKGSGLLDGSNHDVVWFVILIVLGFIPAGRIAGLDDGLSDRLPFLR